MEKELAQAFKVLSVDTRLKIIELLKQRSLCVNALSGILKISQSAVSQHLRILKSAGFVTDERKGYFRHYSLNERILRNYKKILEDMLG